jgi:hypothetical protein
LLFAKEYALYEKADFLTPLPVYSLSSFFLLLLMALCLFAGACGFEPDSLPEITPIPDPNPGPDPVPDPDPSPIPDPSPEPDPSPIPDPTPEPDPDPPQSVWTLVYNANGGDPMLNSTAQANMAQILKMCTRTGCDFAGWAENKDGTPSILAAGTSVPGKTAETTLTLYAQWTVKDAAAVVAAAKDGNTITLTGVAWSNDLKIALETALNGGNITTLDLSGVSGLTVWDTSTLNIAINDKGKITSLALPDTVTTLADQSSTEAFKNYGNLTSVSGAGVTDIGDYAFAMCTKLTTVSLPKATTIGNYAFDMTKLTTVSLPKATTIGNSAFSGTSLTTVSLPKATTIGGNAFRGCTSLTTVSLPKAETIGYNAFNMCTKLTTVSLPAAMSIDYSAFHLCTNLAELFLPAKPPTLGFSVFPSTGSSGTLYIYVGLDNVDDYTSTWGVSAETIAGGNTGKYGEDHKAITITE